MIVYARVLSKCAAECISSFMLRSAAIFAEICDSGRTDTAGHCPLLSGEVGGPVEDVCNALETGPPT